MTTRACTPAPRTRVTPSTSERYCNLNVVLLPGRLPDGEEVVPTSDARLWLADPAHDWTSDFGNAGDFDGDGSADLFVAARGCAPDDGSLYVMLGPSRRWPAAGAMTRSAADGWWSQAEPDDCFADAASGGYDIDGDGLAEAAMAHRSRGSTRSAT